MSGVSVSPPEAESPPAPPAARAETPAPRWVPWLVALVPVFPPLYAAAFGALGRLASLPPLARQVLFAFAASQLLAALFTPRPLASLALAALRTLLILAMIGAGAYLRRSTALRPLLWGYLAVFATAWAVTLAEGGLGAVAGSRLGHPYYYFVSLGLLGAIALWQVVSWRGGAPWWRFAVGAFALATLVATGSRGPLLAFAVGAVAAVFAGSMRYLRSLAILGLIAALAFGFVPALRDLSPLERLFSGGLSGRDEVWQGALTAWRDSPLGGQGPYQIGPYLWYLYKDPCQLTPTLEQAGVTCPAWLTPFKGAWLIAHNLALHSLAETGLIGTLGLAALLVLGGMAVWRTREGFLVAIFFGFLAMSFVDVVTAVPSPHFSELFWVAVGMGLARWGAAPEPPPGPPAVSPPRSP